MKKTEKEAKYINRLVSRYINLSLLAIYKGFVNDGWPILTTISKGVIKFKLNYLIGL